MSDPTDSIRRELVAEINADPGEPSGAGGQARPSLGHRPTPGRIRGHRLHGPACWRPTQIGWRQGLVDVPASSEIVLWFSTGVERLPTVTSERKLGRCRKMKNRRISAETSSTQRPRPASTGDKVVTTVDSRAPRIHDGLSQANRGVDPQSKASYRDRQSILPCRRSAESPHYWIEQPIH